REARVRLEVRRPYIEVEAIFILRARGEARIRLRARGPELRGVERLGPRLARGRRAEAALTCGRRCIRDAEEPGDAAPLGADDIAGRGRDGVRRASSDKNGKC